MKRLLLLCCAITTLSGCLILDGSFSEKEIVSFSFLPASNAGLLKSYYGVIDEDTHTIAISVPNYMDVTKLVATFGYNGVAVTVKGLRQESGVTAQDFSGPLTYSIRGKDDEYENYTVRLTVVAPSSDTSIRVLGIGQQYGALYSRVNAYNSTIELYDTYGWTQRTTLYLSFQTEGVKAIANGNEIFPSVYPYYRYGEYSSNFLDFSNPMDIVVYAEDGTENTYAVKITSEDAQ